MDGGVCINEVLRQAGWLVLREEPTEPAPLRPQEVDWSRTRAWGEGGYYARIFLNIQGREPQGVIPFAQRDQARRELTEILSSLALPEGPTLTNRVVWPEHAYRVVRGLAPDLIVLFANLSWRSLGTIGHGRLWLVGNDTGVDEANHAQDGLYVLRAARVAPGRRRASILDIAPTLLDLLGLEAPGDLTGTSLLTAAQPDLAAAAAAD
jgi:predicted AlkP superfamily phosphohydrolase/phosphomutase